MVVSCLVPIEASHLRDPPLLVQAACNVHNVHSSIIVLAQIQTPAPLLLAKVVDIIISPQKGSLLLCFPTPCPSMSTLPIQVSWLAPISPPGLLLAPAARAQHVHDVIHVHLKLYHGWPQFRLPSALPLSSWSQLPVSDCGRWCRCANNARTLEQSLPTS